RTVALNEVSARETETNVRRFLRPESTEEEKALPRRGLRSLVESQQTTPGRGSPPPAKSGKQRKKFPSPQDEQCTGRESPSGNSFVGRIVRNAVRGIWSGRNRPQMFRRREGKCLRHDTGLPRHGLERPNNGPCSQCPNGQFHGQ